MPHSTHPGAGLTDTEILYQVHGQASAEFRKNYPSISAVKKAFHKGRSDKRDLTPRMQRVLLNGTAGFRTEEITLLKEDAEAILKSKGMSRACIKEIRAHTNETPQTSINGFQSL